MYKLGPRSWQPGTAHGAMVTEDEAMQQVEEVTHQLLQASDTHPMETEDETGDSTFTWRLSDTVQQNDIER